MSNARPATFAERSVWGTCPICSAAHGAPCIPQPPGSEMWLYSAVHKARLKQAPVMVSSVLVAVR
jgi:hypothetical protein